MLLQPFFLSVESLVVTKRKDGEGDDLCGRDGGVIVWTWAQDMDRPGGRDIAFAWKTGPDQGGIDVFACWANGQSGNLHDE